MRVINPDSNCFICTSSLFLKVNRFLEILFESEFNSRNRYKAFRDEDDKMKKTLLHYAAELGFLHVAKTLVKNYPLLLTMTTDELLKPVKKEPCYRWNWRWQQRRMMWLPFCLELCGTKGEHLPRCYRACLCNMLTITF